MSDLLHRDKALRFLFPLDGDCLFPADGEWDGDALTVSVRLAGLPDGEVTVNGLLARREGDHFVCRVKLTERCCRLNARDLRHPRLEDQATVYLPREAWGGFRLSVDDNIRFLYELTAFPERYPSLFSHPYLRVYQKAHELYGAAVHLNLFYETDVRTPFSPPLPHFSLAEMTDRYRKEWAENASWLQLSFHARQELPNYPYDRDNGSAIARDCGRVQREILRFAGEASLSPVTTVHFGAPDRRCLPVLKELGVRGLMGFFETDASGRTLVSYRYPASLVRRAGERDFFVDHGLGLTFGRVDLVLNNCNMENLLPRLEKILQSPGRSGFLELLIHEQYFYRDYSECLPFFEELVLTACRFASEHGYGGRRIRDLLPEL
ncbi:MAG: hypothetical protein PUC47_00635 [Oscillospiraceae bacterium]|nr:hypothetical protein [Oscillospiraceae bacterium]